MTFRVSIIVAALLSLPSLANAQTANDQWQTSCKDDNCTLVRGVVEQGTDRTVATFIVAMSKNHENARIGVALPLGTALDAGVRLVVSGTTLNIPFQVCFPDGCRATVDAPPAQVDSLAAAETVQLLFFPFSANQPVAVDIPMSGLAAAVASVRANLGSQ